MEKAYRQTNRAFGLPADVDRSYRRLVECLDATIAGWAALTTPR